MLAEIEKSVESEFWEQACNALSAHLPGIFFEHFIRPLDHDLDLESRKLYLIASDDRRITHIEMKYGHLIRQSLAPLLPAGFQVCLISGTSDQPKGTTSIKSDSRRTRDSDLNSDTLDIENASIQALKGFVCDPALEPRISDLCQNDWNGILYLLGPSGCGKSHLARVLSARYRTRSYSMEEFLVSFATASREGTLLEWKKELHGQQLVIIDDLQFLRKKAVRTAEQLRSLMDSALQGKFRLILVADQPASQMDVGPDLRSRLLEARPLELNYLTDARRTSLLEALALRNGLELPDGYATYLAQRISGDHRKLQNAIHRLAIEQLPADPSWTDRLLEDLMQSGLTVEPSRVLDVVCKFYNVHPDLLTSSARDQAVVRARHLSAYFLNRLAGMKLNEIAILLGRKDHSAVLYGIRRTDTLFAQDLFLKKQAASLEAQICQN
ncbi:MAG: DnaA/Hda family protein [Leptospiraceae bacterium]